MPRATSEVEICNLALTEINQRLIASLDSEPSDSPQQTYCKLVYNTARRSLLESYDWSFALNRIKQQAAKVYTRNGDLLKAYPDLYTDEYFGWLSAFPLPADCLKVSDVYDENWHRVSTPQGMTLPWYRQGEYIYTQNSYSGTVNVQQPEIPDARPIVTGVNPPILYLQYVKDLEDVNKFSPSFIEALALTIAQKLTKQFNNSAAFSQVLEVKAARALTEAQRRDARNTNAEGINLSPMLQESSGFGSWGYGGH